MGLQFKRIADLAIGNAGADGFRVIASVSHPGLRIQFEVTKTLRSSLNTASIKVYNLTSDHQGKIKGEFDDIILQAGYEGQALVVFRGQIRHVATPSDGPDHITDIDAADGDKDARKAIVNFTLSAGTTNEQLLDKIAESFSSITRGQVVLRDRKRTRGRVVCGRPTDILDGIASDNDAHWSFQDGKLEMVAADSTLPTEAIVISAKTGMLEAPEVDDKGVKVTCLLNPRIRCNGKIQLDNHDFKLKIAKERERKPGAKAPKKPQPKKTLSRLDPDGIYKVYKVIHKGDTRENDWQSEVYAVALDKAIPAGKAAA